MCVYVCEFSKESMSRRGKGGKGHLQTMLIHREDKDAATFIKKRGPDACTDGVGPSNKRRKEEQGVVSTSKSAGKATVVLLTPAAAHNPSSTSGKVAAPMLNHAAAKKPRKALTKCEHQQKPNTCKDCGGSNIYMHMRVRSECQEYRGASICEHQ